MGKTPPDIRPRQQNTRNKKVIKIPTDLSKIQDDFDINIKNVENKFTLTDDLKNENLSSAKDIWRSQIVFLDSTLDFYIHEITKYGMSKIINDEWKTTPNFNRYKVSMKFVKTIINSPENLSLFLKEIDKINQRSCFMNSKNIMQQLMLIGVSVSSFTEDEVKTIDYLYKRRNEIAHQADCTNGKKNSITEADVKNFIDCVKKLQNKIQEAVKSKG